MNIYNEHKNPRKFQNTNLFNILGVLGASSILSPLEQGNVTWVDIGVMVLFRFALLGLTLNSKTLKRPVGLLFVTAYIGYIIWLVSTSS